MRVRNGVISTVHVLYKYQRGNFKYRFQSENPLPNPSRCTVICSSVCVCMCVWQCVRTDLFTYSLMNLYTVTCLLIDILYHIHYYNCYYIYICRACVHLSLSCQSRMDFQSNLVKLAASGRPKIISNHIRSIYIVVMLKPDFLYAQHVKLVFVDCPMHVFNMMVTTKTHPEEAHTMDSGCQVHI